MMGEAGQKIANQQAVMITIDAVTTCYPISIIKAVGQVLEARIMEFVGGNAGA